MVEDEALKEIERDARERFDGRIESEDDPARALGWDSVESMETRFRAASEIYDFTDARILDVGCGFGDFYDHLVEQGQTPKLYHGVDISDQVLDVARERHPDSNCRFEHRNVLLDPFEDETFDIAVEFGVLNYDVDVLTNDEYVRAYLRRTYAQAEATLVNCLSAYREGDWEYEEFVHYYRPEKVFGYAQELSRDIILKHDFEPVPQKEFHLLVA